ncbi:MULTISPECIES: ABC transporter ATP-binding protein [unclassified Enterococcus]|uniref:ABC transporter ATP-binding protein n=1 Tax=unclassified Enterococcus TaxID=2608891 RepID=UPI0015536A60|nr:MULTISPECIES: ABC transporter ATP-binding protein [unclassified Enterococcus]MBS7578248.1 energy-coupling factor ABC transporter ATP-binding protein [Enterococcus sp. MMGLQ5-2]MBS7585513.1 energy-coupling factor ABC transporter ATP-binding protein [Enterococcus sp. MMGLQ5-1]NPD13372.1 energy-coupling factor ABC transporter ATP-binding protein [Enterococcus sp. MMGLQ5-1]NPD38079.1 energy-coupling factor ABC transporter ATP-binding protein [Enterococcus sp. MMGLQ5-2]
MLEFKAVNFTYQENNIPAIQDINLTIKAGEFIVLTGKSGCGKTTLSRIINGLIPELYEGQLEGNFSIDSTINSQSEIFQFTEKVGSVFQNPKTQFFTTDVLSELAFPCENVGLERQIIQERIIETAKQFEIEHLLDRDMFSLSGGEKQIIAIASAYMLRPQILILDEPSSNLDFQTTNKLQKILAKFKSDGLTVIIIEHRLYYLRMLADYFWIIENGQLIEKYTPAQLINLLDTQRQALGIRAPKLFINPTPVNKKTTPAKQQQILSIANLNYKYPKSSKLAFSIQALQISNQEIIGIIGENGAGKSSFVKALCGLLPSISSKLTMDNQVLTKHKLIQQSFMVFQDVNYQLFCENVHKELLLKAKQPELLEKIVVALDLKALLHRHPSSLSGGEKQRVAIGSAILSGKKVIIFDEPTSGLDYFHMQQVIQMIHYLQSLNVMILIISHDLEFLNETCQRLLIFKEGQITDDLSQKQLTEFWQSFQNEKVN